jgi:hypothetical protein
LDPPERAAELLREGEEDRGREADCLLPEREELPDLALDLRPPEPDREPELLALLSLRGRDADDERPASEVGRRVGVRDGPALLRDGCDLGVARSALDEPDLEGVRSTRLESGGVAERSRVVGGVAALR